MIAIKEKREVGFIVGSLLLVAAVGLFLTVSLEHKDPSDVALSGQATAFNAETPTLTGMLAMLESSCSLIDNPNSLTCADVCDGLGTKYSCLPLEIGCFEESPYACRCCEDISQ